MTAVSCGPSDPARRNDSIEIRVVHSLDDWMKVAAVRAIVFMGEQSCPYDEEFDGNDLTGTQILALVDGEPAATMRIRYFSGFAKLERMAVRAPFRHAALGRRIFAFVREFCERKGYGEAFGQCQVRLLKYMQECFGAEQIGESFHFSDHQYHPIRYPMTPAPAHFTILSDPMVLQRPEGDWDRPGVLDQSAERAPSNPGVRDLNAGAPEAA